MTDNRRTGPAVTPKLIPIPEAQKELGGIGTTTIYRLINEGELKKVNIGRRGLITADSINAYITRLSEAARKEERNTARDLGPSEETSHTDATFKRWDPDMLIHPTNFWQITDEDGNLIKPDSAAQHESFPFTQHKTNVDEIKSAPGSKGVMRVSLTFRDDQGGTVLSGYFFPHERERATE